MKKLIVAIVLAVVLVGCGNSDSVQGEIEAHDTGQYLLAEKETEKILMTGMKLGGEIKLPGFLEWGMDSKALLEAENCSHEQGNNEIVSSNLSIYGYPCTVIHSFNSEGKLVRSLYQIAFSNADEVKEAMYAFRDILTDVQRFEPSAVEMGMFDDYDSVLKDDDALHAYSWQVMSDTEQIDYNKYIFMYSTYENSRYEIMLSFEDLNYLNSGYER